MQHEGQFATVHALATMEPVENGTAKWVPGVSANGEASGQPNTYAYWTGGLDGTAFTPDTAEPQWLDHGWDWYGAVTFEKRDADGRIDERVRRTIAWLNNWDHENTTPTIDSDGYNGTDSIVREVTLKSTSSGACIDGCPEREARRNKVWAACCS